MPGIAASTSETCVLGSAPNDVSDPENNFDLDIIVFATGYDAMTGPLLNMNITGKQNLKLDEIVQTFGGQSEWLKQ